jgi:membrane associated rhomboid family serine protease
LSSAAPSLPVRVSRDKRKVNDWSLVLTAANVEHDVRPVELDWVVLVGDDDLAPALVALEAFDHEQRQAAAGPPPVAEYGRTHAALWYAAALVLFYFWVEYSPAGAVWEDGGRAYAARIRAGELWRVVTALTLHANLVHVLGNAVIGAVFAGALSRAVGPGTALWVMLLSGGLGNLVNALLRGSAHAAVGASTAIFGAFGALAGLQSARRYHSILTRRKAWVPAAAALAMLAMLGAGEDSDVWAHLFGLLAGFGAGIGVANVFRRPPAPRTEHVLVVLGVLAVTACWLLVLW